MKSTEGQSGEIRKAVEEIFNVHVAGVAHMHVQGKFKQRGDSWETRDWKKAVVTLLPGERIDFFEGV